MRWFLGFIIPYSVDNSVDRKNLFVLLTEIYTVLVLILPCIRGNYLKTYSEKKQKESLPTWRRRKKTLGVFS